MGKLFIFAIGGTGSRVLRSLTFLLASGVKASSDTIVPIIIDPDQEAADLTRATDLLRSYNKIRKDLSFSETERSRFFEQEIEESVAHFQLPLNINTGNGHFRDYISESGMGKENQAFVNLLFSQKNLDADMTVGFKGNPNMGSVVLNQFSASQAFKEFANAFRQGDKIFIVSSIFGGTGASGFPLLTKVLRSQDKNIPNSANINAATIGAVTVLPYFGIKQDENSAIDSSTFIAKTRAALLYYYENISENNSLDYLYYLADEQASMYENCEGGKFQQNDAHLIEFLAALAILDFDSSLEPEAGKRRETVHKEFGMKEMEDYIHFSNFDDKTKEIIEKPLIRFSLFRNYFQDRDRSSYVSQSWVKDKDGVNMEFFKKPYFEEVHKFQNSFAEWLKELQGNKRSLDLFDFSKSKESPFSIVKGTEQPRKSIFKGVLGKKDYALFDRELNSAKSQSGKDEQRFMDRFYSATSELADKQFNI